MHVLIGRIPYLLAADGPVLGGGMRIAFEDDPQRDFLSSLEQDFWRAATTVELGQSLNGLHTRAVAGIVGVVNKVAPQARIMNAKGCCAVLAEWLIHGLEMLSPRQRRTLICSAAHKAMVFGQVPVPRHSRLLEIGPGPGFIAWLLSKREWPGLRNIVFVEPQPIFSRTGARLWQHETIAVDVIAARAENASWQGMFDVVLLSGSLLLVDPPRRRELLDRIRDSLAPQGTVLVMERIRQPIRPTGDTMWEKCLSLEELLSLLSIVAPPRLYHPVNSFRGSVEPRSLPVERLLQPSVFVAQSP